MKAKHLLLAILTICLFSLTSFKTFAADEIVGKWKYTVSNVPPEYETGVMTFEQKDGKLTGYLGEAEKTEFKDLVVDQGKVTFKMDFQGGTLTFTLAQAGDKLSGVIVGQDGEYPIAAVKEAAKN
ncbi:hypothetical protein FEN17_09755 [Dyadobacter luticola]|uniref:Extracellular endo-alpha-(1->5)-L-arabinanase C-terminal domain-containing protein n=2 Tax=Dyadobacter luticola TaxID=1979387 RepID=A0A5R9L6U1_9BACT|nr:hypothetical protein FEN17_09755 [Dyadobacter luticola]